MEAKGPWAENCSRIYGSWKLIGFEPSRIHWLLIIFRTRNLRLQAEPSAISSFPNVLSHLVPDSSLPLSTLPFLRTLNPQNFPLVLLNCKLKGRPAPGFPSWFACKLGQVWKHVFIFCNGIWKDMVSFCFLICLGLLLLHFHFFSTLKLWQPLQWKSVADEVGYPEARNEEGKRMQEELGLGVSAL